MAQEFKASEMTFLGGDAVIDFAAAATGEKRIPTFQTIAYNGGTIRVPGIPLPIAIDLTGVRAARSVTILKDHDNKLLLGQATDVQIGKDTILAAGLITGDEETEPHVKDVMSHARKGFNWQTSVGVGINKLEKVEAGRTVTVNGKPVYGPAFVLRDGVLKEISVTSVGCDHDTEMKIAASNAADSTNIGEEIMAEETKQKEAAETTPKAVVAPPVVETPVVEASADPIAEMREQMAKAVESSAKIHELCAASGDTSIEAQAIREGWTPEKTELHCLRAARTKAPAVIIGGSETTAPTAVLEAACATAGGMQEKDLLAHFGEETYAASRKRFRSGLGLQQLLLEAAWANGYTGRSIRGNVAIKDVLQAAFSTLSLPGIMSNTANKFLLQGYSAVEDSWRKVSAIKNATDFKTMTSYRLNGNMKFEQVAPSGEIRHGTVSEESYTNKVDTYGKMFSVTRQDIVNDDLGALTAIPRMIGRGYALKLNEAIWTEFKDNASFFTSGNGSLITDALDIDGLTAATIAFDEQTDPDGNPLLLDAQILLVPPALEVTATNIFNGVTTHEVTASGVPVPNINPHAGMYEVVKSRYLSTSNSGSDTAWYLLANPMDLATIEVAFLNGVQTPTVEQTDADFNTLGIQMRGYADFGVNKQEYRGGVKSTGAA